MLPCVHGVDLHKSASFKKTPSKIQTNHKNDAKIDPIWKQIKNASQKWCVNTSKHIRRKKTQQIIRCWIPFGTRLLETFLVWRVWFATWCSEPLRGTPWTDFGLSWAPVVGFSCIVASVGEPFYSKQQRLQGNNSIVRKQIAPTTTSTKQARVLKKMLIINPSQLV